jgi:hypothetical protein
MAVYLSLRQVREEILEGGRSPSRDALSSDAQILLAELFHDVFAELVGQDARWNWGSALGDQDPDPAKWRQSLVDHCYRRLIAHRLERHKGDLQQAGREVCLFWEAAQALCAWLVERLWAVYHVNGRLLEPQSSVRCDLPFELEIKEPGWTDAVRLTEIDETVWRAPDGDQWCAVDLAFDTPREAGPKIGQAGLYCLLLRAAEPERKRLSGALAIMTFSPKREEQVFEAARLDATLRQIKAQIGQLAGVIPNWLKTVDDVRRPRELPPQYAQITHALLETLREFGAPARLAGPPQVAQNSLRFTVIPGEGVQVAKIKQLADALKLRLRLQNAPLIDAMGAEVLISIERANRPIVFYWPR